jgi:inosine-uridine nucleoside N-ribohydrolase
MMRKDSKLVTERIGRIVCMGGALDVPGNTSPMAEFNFFSDPYAVKELLISTPLHQGLPLNRFVLLPLDITTPHELLFPEYKKHVDPAFHNSSLPSISYNKSPLTHFTSSFLEKTREIMLQYGKDAVELHDIVAVWCAIENPPYSDDEPMVLAPGWQGCNRIFDIERTGEITRGMLVVDRREDESYLPGANRAEVQKGLEITPNPISGVFCITHTPGPATLSRLLLNRVWGCRHL